MVHRDRKDCKFPKYYSKETDLVRVIDPERTVHLKSDPKWDFEFVVYMEKGKDKKDRGMDMDKDKDKDKGKGKGKGKDRDMDMDMDHKEEDMVHKVNNKNKANNARWFHENSLLWICLLH